MYYTYIIESQQNARWYIGHSIKPTNRVKEHNSGQTRSTRNKGPWELIFIREFQSKLEANRFELKLKKLKNKEYIRSHYKDFFYNFGV